MLKVSIIKSKVLETIKTSRPFLDIPHLIEKVG